MNSVVKFGWSLNPGRPGRPTSASDRSSVSEQVELAGPDPSGERLPLIGAEGPSGSLESRTATIPGRLSATSTQFPPLLPL
jgi:hypothetical protein